MVRIAHLLVVDHGRDQSARPERNTTTQALRQLFVASARAWRALVSELWAASRGEERRVCPAPHALNVQLHARRPDPDSTLLTCMGVADTT